MDLHRSAAGCLVEPGLGPPAGTRLMAQPDRDLLLRRAAQGAHTPNGFADLAEVETRLLDFQDHYEQIAQPFEWKFTSADLDALLAKLQQQPSPPFTAEAA